MVINWFDIYNEASKRYLCQGCKKYFSLTPFCAVCTSALMSLSPETLRRLADIKEQATSNPKQIYTDPGPSQWKKKDE